MVQPSVTADNQPKIELCLYCQKNPGTTRDHVIPECLFIKPFPPVMPKVPACGECNQIKKSGDDSYLRDFLVTDLYCNVHPVAKELSKSKLLRSVKRNSSDLARGIDFKRPNQPLFSPAGLYLGHYPTIPLDQSRVEKIFTTIIRGLYYEMRKLRIPDNYVFDLGRVEPLKMKEFMAEMEVEKMNGPNCLGNVFWCYSTCTTEDPFTTAWVMGFYGGYFVWAYTYPPGFLDEVTGEGKKLSSDD